MDRDLTAQQETNVALTRWADRYTARLDQELTNAWPDLADRLEGAVTALPWSGLAFGASQDFQRCVEQAVQGWVKRHVDPVIEDATADLAPLCPACRGLVWEGPCVPAEGRGQLRALDVVKGLALPGGALVAGGAVTAAVVTTTKLLVLTTVVVHWPLLIAGLAAGGVLAAFGGAHLARLKDELRRRFRERLLPRVKAGIIGDGVTVDGQHFPSLAEQLKRQVRGAAEAARPALGEKGVRP